MVARADRAELRLGELRQLALWRELSGADLLEHGVVDALLRRDTHAERDPARDLAHDRVDAAERVEIGARELGASRLVAAADVVADAGRRDVSLVGDAAADRLRVARVMVGAEDAERGVACLHAALELLEAALVDVAERLDVHVSILLFLSVVWQETPDGFEPPWRALQARASPLGHGVTWTRWELHPRATRPDGLQRPSTLPPAPVSHDWCCSGPVCEALERCRTSVCGVGVRCSGR